MFFNLDGLNSSKPDFCLTLAKRFPSPLVERGQRGEAVFRYSEAYFGAVHLAWKCTWVENDRCVYLLLTNDINTG